MKQTMTLAGILLAFTLCLTTCGDHNAKSNVNVPTEYCEELVKLAKNGNVVAQYNLALCYDQGEGVAQSKTEAANWYRMAAEQGLAQAQYNLGVCYARGLGVEQSFADAVVWYKKAAAQGDAKAQFNLALMYIRGTGVEKSETEAIKLLQKAAEQGLEPAIEILNSIRNGTN